MIIAIASASALVGAVVCEVLSRHIHKRMAKKLIVERVTLANALDKLEDRLNGKDARRSPMKYVEEAANRLRRIRMGWRI